MSWEPYRFVNEAQCFLLAQRDWLVRVATRFLNRYRLPNVGEDIVQNLAIKCLNISNEKWNGISNKKAYFAKVIRNEVINLIKKYPGGNQPLSDCILPSTPIDAIEAACVVLQILPKLSPEETQLLDLVFAGHSWSEVAEWLQITPATARKRWSRLRKKLRLLIQERGDEE